MEETGTRKTVLIAVAGVVLVVLGIIAYFFYPSAQPGSDIPELDTGPDIGAQVSGAVESPADKLPETNPFSGYKNPFE